jgi:hypothetical protein
MYNVFVPVAASHLRRSWATNSGPLSERMCSGMPRSIMASARTSITFRLLSLRRGRIARHSRVNSSIRFSIRTVLPSWVNVLTKSYDQT